MSPFRLAVLVFALPATLQLQARAQSAASSPADTTAPVVVFAVTTMAGAPQYVVLARDVAYRVDVIPVATVSIAPRTPSAGAPPSVLHHMENPAGVEGGTSYLIRPHFTGEYRVEVHGSDGPVLVRIVRDPRETALLAGHARPSLAMLTVGVAGAAVLGSFQTARNRAGDSLAYMVRGGAVGLETCIGLKRGRFTAVPRLGGCLMAVSWLRQSGGARLLLFGLAPRYLLSRPTPSLEISGMVEWQFGQARGGLSAMYSVYGAGAVAEWRRAFLTVKGTAGLGFVRRGSFEDSGAVPTRRYAASTTLVPLIGLGLEVGL